MNAHVEPRVFASETDSEIEPFAFEAMRGKAIDAFVDLELIIGLWLQFLGEPDSSSQLLGKRIDRLSKHEALADKAGPKQAKHIQALPSTVSRFADIRNALVHGHRSYGTRNGSVCVFIQLLADVLNKTPRYFVFTENEIDDAVLEISQQTKRLKFWLNQIKPTDSPQGKVEKVGQ